jgi:CO/xanthine dehydrogenase Mo-binding subunit
VDERLIDEAARRLGLQTLCRRAEDRRAAGEPVGVGLALFVEANGGGIPERVRLSVDRFGAVEVVTGAAPAGQGLATLLAQIVADVLGVDPAVVRVATGRSDRVSVAGGTLMSSTSARVGTAALHAAETVRERVLSAAGALLGIDPARLTIEAGRIRVADRHVGTALTLGEIAHALEPGGALAGDDPAGLAAEGSAREEAHTVSFGLAAVVAQIDPMTGIVRVPRALVASEVGNAVHPAMVDGQLAAGAVHGLAVSLFTAFEMSDSGDPLATGLADLLLPGAREAAGVETIVAEDSPSGSNPLGIKGTGEAGTTGIGAALAAAVDDALQMPGFVRRLPIDPAQVLGVLRERRSAPLQTGRRAAGTG